jgi:hypothetical protein
MVRKRMILLIKRMAQARNYRQPVFDQGQFRPWRQYRNGCWRQPKKSQQRDHMQKIIRQIAAEINHTTGDQDRCGTARRRCHGALYGALPQGSHRGLDDIQLRELGTTASHWCVNSEDRRETVLRNIDEQGKLTPALRMLVEAAATKQDLEDP